MSDLKPLLEAAGREAPEGEIDLDGVVRRGTQLRRQRTLRRALSGVAAVAVLGGAGYLGVTTLGSGPSPQPAGTLPVASRTGPASSPTSSTPLSLEAATRLVLAPHGTTHVSGASSRSEGRRVVATLTDSRGMTTITATVAPVLTPAMVRNTSAHATPTTCAAALATSDYAGMTCSVRNGALVLTATTSTAVGTAPVVTHAVVAIRPAVGIVVTLEDTNISDDKQTVTRPEPALSAGQLVELAMSAEYGRVRPPTFQPSAHPVASPTSPATPTDPTAGAPTAVPSTWSSSAVPPAPTTTEKPAATAPSR